MTHGEALVGWLVDVVVMPSGGSGGCGRNRLRQEAAHDRYLR